ncbi:unnamed protein product [Lymnaea stagnalis]|uniref:NFX1-type zinc finger-containing protein 1 n=1 Tax=Lymnaea stagnalis TaxID=6523 RepID=A0AAV2ID59_LYMST
MGFARLKTWAETEDAGSLILFMCAEYKQIELFLSQNSIKEDWFFLLVKAVNHALSAQHQKESIKKLLEVLCRGKFFETHLVVFFLDKSQNGNSWVEAKDVFTWITNILKEILDKLPLNASSCMVATSILLQNACTFSSISSSSDLMDTIRELTIKARTVRNNEMDREQGKKGAKFLKAGDDEQPPDNFMDISVIPTVLDLKEDSRPFVRKAITEGVYEDAKHYLDVQFRLMRQDFVLPLRQGINDFIKNGSKKDFWSSDLRFYSDVHIAGMVSRDGIDHILQFDVSKLKNIKWESSKRLIFGSLVCLSKDNFKNVVFATVAHRDVKLLVKGNISVNVKSGHDIVFNSTSSDVFIMAETTAYFESYCHVLEGLQEMSTNLPLQDYIIKCKKELKPPKYLLPSGGIVHGIPMYNISPLMLTGESIDVPVLTTIKWPQANTMCLNESQREAAILALTKEMAVIQGPPGTGKTYVGLKVMEVLLKNKQVMAGSVDSISDPILVVCYTNHALDQFLEGVLKFCPDGIVRVGGRNSSEQLEKFNIKNLKLKLRSEKSFVDRSVRNSKSECMRELKEVSEVINGKNTIMNNLETEIQDEEVLREFMLERHHASLGRGGQKKSQMRQWLNASNETPQAIIPQMIKQHLTKLVLKWTTVSENLYLTEKMDITQRASLYMHCVMLYRNALYQEMTYLSQQYQNQFIHGQIQNLERMFQLSFTAIIPDQLLQWVLQEYLTDSFFETIYKMVERGKKAQFTDHVVEAWLLGLHKDFHGQLDEIQTLTNLLSGEEVDRDTFDDSEMSKLAQDERMIDDGDDDEDEEGGPNYDAKVKLARNSMASVIQRVEMLGIKEDTLPMNESEAVDEWTTVSHAKPLTFRKIRHKLLAIKPMTDIEEDRITDVWALDLNKRYALYNCWIKKFKEQMTSQMEEYIERYTAAFARKQEINREETLFLLRKARVIGMTTTGAAKHRAVLQALGCRIIVVEEAAEVLESHIVTALNKKCNHLILIGDHQQLRPNPTVYLLAKKFGLEISLFERLIKNGVPHVLLKEQHRMRPEISKIMQHIYPELQNHLSVFEYARVRGLSKDIFFIDHKEKETKVDDTKSKANLYEAKYVVCLCKYFMLQGYDPSEVTILATYTGQVFAIKKTMKEMKFEARVRVTAVDNYQGEENQIIILSLVRSNVENNVGFLKVDNRVCVALSRAKKGLFVIGNFESLETQSGLWKNIVATAKDDNIIGNGLPVCCQNHPEFQEVITSYKDFELKCPEGGCGRPCSYRLNCGHVCARKCHGYDLEHTSYKCSKPCAKTCPEGHNCSKKCFQECGDCKEMVKKVIPLCGHKDLVRCHMAPIKAVCSQQCSSLLGCEHQCPGKCGVCRINGLHSECTFQLQHAWPCGHISSIACGKKQNQIPCPKECNGQLDCGHKCKGTCSECLGGAVHVACKEKCKKLLPCGHKCEGFCGVACLPCTKPCPTKCVHGACYSGKSQQMCGHECIPCKEPCRNKCSHNGCVKLCSEMCSKPQCNERCNKKVHVCNGKSKKKDCKDKMHSCTHKCSGLCGEGCVCAICQKVTSLPIKKENKASVPEQQVQSMDQGENKIVIKVPGCHHVYYVDEFDAYVKNFDPEGSKNIECPACSKPIVEMRRYQDIINARAKNREAVKRELIKGSEVSKEDKRELQLSQNDIGGISFLDEFRVIHGEDVQNKNEMTVLSFQLKCAFMLGAILSVGEGASEDPLTPIKKALLKINSGLTKQQRDEFTTELLKRLRSEYLRKLEEFGSLYEVAVPVHWREQINESRRALSQQRAHKDSLDRAKHVVDSFKRMIVNDENASSFLKMQCEVLQNSIERATKVMTSDDDEMLHDVLHPEEKARKAMMKLKSSINNPTTERAAPPTERLSSKLASTPMSSLIKHSAQGQQLPSLGDWGKEQQTKLAKKLPEKASEKAPEKPFSTRPQQECFLINLESDSDSSEQGFQMDEADNYSSSD